MPSPTQVMRTPAAVLLLLLLTSCTSDPDDENSGSGGSGGSASTSAGSGNSGGMAGSTTAGGAAGTTSGGAAGNAGNAGNAGSAGGMGMPGSCEVTPVAPVASTPTSGLLDEWTFEGLDDRAVVETSGNYEGFLRRAVWRPGKFGNALKLYGMTESSAEVLDFDEALGSNFTLSLWIQTTDKYTIGQEYQPAPRQSILKKGSLAAGGFELWTAPDGTFNFSSVELGDFNSGVDVMDRGETGSLTLPWHHLAVTYDGSHVTLFVDNVATQFSASGSIASVTDILSFGDENYWGLIDQVRIYDQALGTSDISALFAESAYTPTLALDTGTVVAKVDAGTGTDGIDGFSADQAFSDGGWGYVDGGTSTTAIFAENTYSIYDLNYMFKSRRESSSTLGYKFTVPNGDYKVKLYFIEADLGKAARSMNVSIEGAQVLTNYNVLSDAKELRTAVRKDFDGIAVADGELTLDLTPVVGEVSIAGIVVQQDDDVEVAWKSGCAPLGPLYEDPTDGKLRDSSSIYNANTEQWLHFGLAQQADDSFSDDSFIAAEMSNDGRGPWSPLAVPAGRSENDFGPVVVHDTSDHSYHLFSGSYLKGLRHYTSADDTLLNWNLEAANAVPGPADDAEWDPAAWKVGDTWYLDTTVALYESSDLFTWELSEHSDEWPRNGNQNENPTVFFFKGYWWYTADTTNRFWRSTTGYSDWTDMGATRMTGEGGERYRDQGNWTGNFQRYTFGHDAIIQDDHCYLFYDVKYEGRSSFQGAQSKVVNQVVECVYIDGTLYTDANAPFTFSLGPSQRDY